MKPRHWMQIAAVASAVGLAGSAIANDNAIGQNTQSTIGQNTQSTNESAASVIDQATPRPAYAPRVDSALQSNDLNGSSSMSTNDVNGNASSTASDPNNNAQSNTNDNGANASTNDNGANASGSNDNGTNNGLNDNESGTSGTTQGSTMQSPKSTNGLTSGLPSNAKGGQRLSTTNSSNFNAWASDYASQHNGRITRDEFLNQMGQRFDQLDAQHQGALTPYQVEEIFIFTPANPSAAQSNGQSGPASSEASPNGSSSSTTSNTNLQ